MKTCKQMVNSLLERKFEYDLNKKAKQKTLIRTLVPVCCICLVALMGVGAMWGGLFDKQPPQTAEDATIPGIKDWYGPNEIDPTDNITDNSDIRDMRGMIIYENKTYVQNLSLDQSDMQAQNIVLDKKIGNGNDFDGTYNEEWIAKEYDKVGVYHIDTDKIASEVFTVKDHPDWLCVKLDNGAYIILEAE